MNRWTVIVAVIIAASATVMASSINQIESQQPMMDALDSTTILLDLKKVPAGDYIVLYSSSPKIITSGGIVAKLPCDDNSEPKDWMLLGGVRTDLTTFQSIKVDLIQGTPGSMCAFGASIPNESVSNISGIVLVNTSGDAIRFPRTSSIVVTVQSVAGQEVHVP